MADVKGKKEELAVKDASVVVEGFGAFKSPNEEVVGLDVNQSDIQLPKYKLLQTTSPEVTKCKDGSIKAGQFYNTVTGEAKDAIDCILLDQGKSMVNWKKPFKRGEDPLCRSFNGKVKVDADGVGDGNCETCQYSSQNQKAWNNLPEGETKPACNMSYVFLALDCETRTPFRIIAAGASVKTTKGFMNKLIPLNIAPFACKVTFGSHQEENDQGVFYVLDYNNFRPNDDAMNPDGKTRNEKAYQELKTMSLALKKLFMTEIVERDIIDVEQGADGKDGELF